jgi:hypothetical protein
VQQQEHYQFIMEQRAVVVRVQQLHHRQVIKLLHGRLLLMEQDLRKLRHNL